MKLMITWTQERAACSDASWVRRVAIADLGDAQRARQMVGHPIHDANIYLTASLRRRLWEEEGVRGYRFVQCEGEAVFIPAGCPHQVYNLRSSIKVAEDFVSPEHIERCLRLTEQFRALPLAHRRKVDALGVKDIILHSVSQALSVLGDESADARALTVDELRAAWSELACSSDEDAAGAPVRPQPAPG